MPSGALLKRLIRERGRIFFVRAKFGVAWQRLSMVGKASSPMEGPAPGQDQVGGGSRISFEEFHGPYPRAFASECPPPTV
jgi:hypothetical protein